MRNKKRNVIMLASVAAAATAILAVSWNLCGATINGEPLTYNEFKRTMDGNRAKVSAYFQSRCNADAGEHFWTTDFNGEVPLDKLKKDAPAGAAVTKVQQIVAKEKGIVKDITYETFLKNLKAHLADQAFEQTMDERIRGAQVVVNDEVYERIGDKEVN